MLSLFGMGLARLGMVKLSGYHEVVSEYGVHWNFFFTLATVKILGSLISSVLPVRRCALYVGIVISLFHQSLLSFGGLMEIVVGREEKEGERESILDANREGLASVLGYLALYFVGLQMGVVFRKIRGRLKEWFFLLGTCVVWSITFAVLALLAEIYIQPPSRRMANLSYGLWTAYLTCQTLTCFLVIEVLQLFGCAMQWPLFSYSEKPFDLLEPCALQRINKRGLLHFVVANVATGLVNFCMETQGVDDTSALVILILYSCLLTVIVFVV